MKAKHALTRVCGLAATLAASASPCLAAAKGYAAPQLEGSPPWLAVVFALVFLALLMAAAFKNSRRTHLD